MLEKVKEKFHGHGAFALCAMLCGFLICCHYAIIRPISNSLFLHFFSAKLLPYAWLATVPLNFFLVSVYNRLIPKWGSKKLFLSLLLIVTVTNALFGLFAKTVPSLTFFYYVWKEVYIMMMFQLLWSVINANIKLENAKFLYGIFFGLGGLGSLFGSMLPGFFAVAYGTESLILWVLPVDLILLFVYLRLNHYCSGDVPQADREQNGGFFYGMQLIRKSRFLIFALLIVVFMQMVTAIADFQFNDFLGKIYPLKDERTEFSARIMGLMHCLTICLQFSGSFFLLKWLGFKKTHYLIPSSIAVLAALIAIVPVFPVITLAFMTSKALDFSLFGVVREMLYIPLKPDEKFRAKAVIDVFAARSSKALASLLIIGITSIVSSYQLTWLSLSLAVLWIGSVAYGLKDYRAEEIRS
ncbi:MAG: hypothetical protein JSS30_02715 [Verrucomicrobia bacterium]|nr:hypothetical protein [Verrucomicrobiota bacterium]